MKNFKNNLTGELNDSTATNHTYNNADKCSNCNNSDDIVTCSDNSNSDNPDNLNIESSVNDCIDNNNDTASLETLNSDSTNGNSDDESPNIAESPVATESPADAELESTKPQFRGWQRKAAQFVTAQTVSLFGSLIVRYVIMWYIMLQTQSGMMTTIITLCSFLPQMLVSMFAGSWADRYSRKKLIIISDSFIAMSSMALALYFLFGGTGLWMMFLITGFSSFGTGIQTPAVNALIPQIVPKDKLVRVNSVMSGLQAVTMLLAPALSAILISNFDLYVAFGIDVITALAAVVITAFLSIKPLKRVAKAKQHLFKDIGDSLKYIGSQSYLRILFIIFAVMMFVITPAAMLTPLQVTRTYGDNVLFLSIVEVAFSVGMLVGGIIIGITGGSKNRIRTIAIAFICFATLTVLLGISGLIPLHFYFYAAFMLLLGLSLPAMNIAFTTLLQENIEPDMMGRVFGIITIINTSIMPLSMLLYGPLSDIVKIEWIMVVSGILQFIIVPFTKLVKVPQKKLVSVKSIDSD